MPTKDDLAPGDPNKRRKGLYHEWAERQKIPIVREFFVPDLRKLELGSWERKGGYGTLLNMIGTREVDDARVCEIPPGAKLNPDKHLYEEMIFVISGRGQTTVWNDKGERESFQWSRGSLFAPPLNTRYQHENLDPKEPARFLAVTNAPVILSIFNSEDFISRCDYRFGDRYSGEPGYFSKEPESLGGRVWKVNLVSDVYTHKLIEWERRGKKFGSSHFYLSGNVMVAHITELPVGIYAKAHRHGPGAHVVTLKGEGYSLVWEEGKEKQRFDWGEGSILVPPEGWFHQHFNLGREPLRQLALRWNTERHWVLGKSWKLDTDLKEGGDQIGYEDEDPSIRETFEKELRKRGIASAMGHI